MIGHRGRSNLTGRKPNGITRKPPQTARINAAQSRPLTSMPQSNAISSQSSGMTARRLPGGEQHLREVLDSLMVVVVVVDVEGCINTLNAFARQAIERQGMSADDVIGTKLIKLPWITSPTQELLSVAIERAARGESVQLDQVVLVQGEQWIYYEVAVAPMHDGRKAINYLILSAVDVTERNLAEKQARDQQAELAHLERVQTMGHMASGLAHELNQPLGAIVNYAAACRQMIAEGVPNQLQINHGLECVVAEAKRAGEIIRRLRGFVQKQPAHSIAMDVNATVRESIQILSFELRHAGAAPKFKLAPNLPSVLADPIQVMQVLVNLVRNAVEAMQAVDRSKRRLSISTDFVNRDDMVRVRVNDNGIGVPDVQVPRLFEAFFSSKATGLGLGLSLSRMIIENHGGRIAAKLNRNGGMTFSFTLRAASIELKTR